MTLLTKAPTGDARNRQYPVTAEPGDRRRIWPCPPVLNQRDTGYCHGYAWALLLLAAPGKRDVDRATADRLARRLQLDAISDTNAAPGFLLKQGIIEGYEWAQNIDQVRDAIVNTGPAVLGCPWFDSMYSPRRGGSLAVRPQQRPMYHFILIRGYNPKRRFGLTRRPAFRLRNSWGSRWGRKGDAWIAADDLDRLIRFMTGPGEFYEAGAVCVPIGKKPELVATLLS